LYRKGVNLGKREKALPPEFRSEAIRLYKMSGRNLNETAAEIGVSVN